MTWAEPTNITGIVGMFDYAVSVWSPFIVMVLITLYLTIFLWLKGRAYLSPEASLTAGFVTSLSAVFLYFAGLITGHILFWPIALTMISALWTLKGDD